MRIVVIGAGNVATHLVQGLAAAGHTIVAVCSRTLSRAQTLAATVGASAADHARLVPTTADAYLIAASDSQIESIAQALPCASATVVHTSGATPIDALAPHAHRAVLYPCQTFSAADTISWPSVPLLVEYSTPQAQSVVEHIATSLSTLTPRYASSHQRACLHLAAAIASNFGNHMLTIASEFMERQGLDFGLLRPLMQQTIDKAFGMPPREAQTGPARRADTSTLERHRLLIDDPQMRRIYDTISQSIVQMYDQGR